MSLSESQTSRTPVAAHKRAAQRPLNLGHRGALSLAPENTLAAFAAAREAGADGIEFDVQLSKDGEVIVVHDERLERTTNGQGNCFEQTLADLKRLDAGHWFDASFKGECIPTLQEVIDLCAPPMFLNIELKNIAAGEALANKVVACVQRNDLRERVVISSFNWALLAHVRAADASLPIGLLFEKPVPAERLTTLNAEAIHPNWRLVDEQLVAQAHARGQQVNVWTVNEEADLRRMLALGVDAIITNFPQRLRSIFDERGA